MSLLIVAPVEAPTRESLRTTDPDAIARALAAHGVRFERWPTRPLGDGAGPPEVLAAYADEVARLSSEGGYASVDVVRMRRDPSDAAWPEKARGARAKFLEEHTHAEDEVRFFVEGAGLFCLRLGEEMRQVMCVMCERGDLISVPAGTRHWFDMGEEPAFCAIRFFGTAEGWVAKFTGDAVARSFPTFDAVARSAA